MWTNVLWYVSTTYCLYPYDNAQMTYLQGCCHESDCKIGSQIFAFNSFKYISSNRIARTHVYCKFKVSRRLYTVFHNDCSGLSSHQQCMRILLSSLPCPHLLFFCFSLDGTHPNNVTQSSIILHRPPS